MEPLSDTLDMKTDEPQTMRFHDQWQEIPDTQKFDNGFKAQWEMFIRHVLDDTPYEYDLAEGAKGVQLAEAAGLLRDPDMAVTRMGAVLAVHGIGT